EVRELLAPLRTAGLDVRTTVDEGLALPAAVGHAVYRVVQESSTNVLRHARATAVTVAITIDDHTVRVEGGDNGRGHPGPAGGCGRVPCQGRRHRGPAARRPGGGRRAGVADAGRHASIDRGVRGPARSGHAADAGRRSARVDRPGA